MNGFLAGILIATVILLAVTCAVVIGFLRMHEENVIPHVTIECGEPIQKERFFKSTVIFDEDDAEFSIDLSQIDTRVPQDINFMITIYGQVTPVRLTIADTQAPTCTVVPFHMYANEAVPEAAECVTDVYDAQQPVSIEFMTEPDLSCTNTSIVYCKLEDLSGNINIVEIPFIVTQDTTPPVITGTHNFKEYIGDSIAYRTGVNVTDDIDQAPLLEIDNSNVDMNTPGFYTVTYIATDAAGNSSTAEITLELVAKPSSYIEPETLMATAQDLLNRITTPDMSDMEVALKIFHWCRYHIYYSEDRIDSSSWTRAAYDGLTKFHGTCYTYAMAARALLNAAGIENQIIERDPYRWSKHYWNYICIDGQWYHCDSTPRIGYGSYLFMYTDAELARFFVHNYNGYSFDHSKHPASATESVQNRINYGAGRLR